MINSFRDDYKFLSNFYPCKVEFEGIVYPSVEHAFQAAKTFDKDKRLEISNIKNPVIVKRLGKKLDLREDWENVKVDIMRSLIESKFSNLELKLKLVNTKNEELVEGNKWHDNFWGSCSCERCSNKDHHNMLGKLLMEVRNKCKDEIIELFQKRKHYMWTVSFDYDGYANSAPDLRDLIDEMNDIMSGKYDSDLDNF